MGADVIPERFCHHPHGAVVDRCDSRSIANNPGRWAKS